MPASRRPIDELVGELRFRDVRFRVDGVRLAVSAPRGALTPELRDELRDRKEELLAWLQRGTGAAAPIPRVPREGDLPLSFGQERWWFLHEIDPGESIQNIAVSLTLRDALDGGALRRALRALLERHEVLRSTFPSLGGRPVCRITETAEPHLREVDFRDAPREAREARALEVEAEEARTPFDLERGPPIRFMVVHLDEEEHHVVVVQHHIVTDRWSLGILIREITVLYDAFRRGRPSPLPEVEVQYVDFAAWQRARLGGDLLAEQLAFWKERVAPPLPVLALPTDRPRGAPDGFRADWLTCGYPAEVSEALKALGRQEGATLFMVLLTGLYVLLSRHTGQTDVLVGSPVAGRVHHQLEDTLGCFLNTLALRADLGSDPGFRDLLRQVKETTLDALSHQDLPFEALVRELHPDRRLARSPLAQVTFSFQNIPESTDVADTVRFLSPGSAGSEITLWMTEVAEGLGATVEYDASLFDASTIRRIMERFGVLLAAAVANPDEPVSSLPLMTGEERSLIVEEWNATEAWYPRDASLCDLVEEVVERAPEAVAVICGEERLTYRELDTRANALARRLRSMGVGPEVLVGVGMERSADMPVAVLAVLKAGGAYVPLDPSFPSARLAFMQQDAGIGIVLTQTFLRDRWGEGSRLVLLDAEGQAPGGDGSAPPPRVTDGDSLAYVMYTSGSTGTPKGVAVHHRAVVNLLASMARQPGLAAADVLLAVTTLSFDISVLELFLPLTVGATVVMASSADTTDGERLAALLASSGATVMQATPATWRLLLDSGWAGSSRLRVLCGGEALPRELADRLLGRCASLWNLYGPTETTVWSTVERVEAEKPVSIGRPIANTRIHVLDPNGRPVPIGVPGEIFIGGDGLARGYLGRPQLTAERFVPDTLEAHRGGRLYRTGDLGRRRADGRLEHLGRIDHQVKIRGFRVELGEVEASLAEHPAVRECVVVARNEHLVAFVRYVDGEEPTVTEVRRHLAGRLPAYMVPSQVVPLQSLPRTPNGKLDRKQLPGVVGHPEQRSRFEPPATPAEELLARIWRELLQVERVGAADNFFELGGHSLLTLRVVHAVEEATGVRLDPRSLFFRTLRELASGLAGGDAREAAVRPRRGAGLAGRDPGASVPAAGALGFRAWMRWKP